MRHVAAKPRLVLPLLSWLALAAGAWAQGPVHYQHKAYLPPGAIGQQQLQRGGPLPGYFQPVEISAPQGTLVSLAAEGGFTQAAEAKALAGMLIGQVYRLKVSNIEFHEGAEVFPTIEVIDRLYPPPGQAARFPIPVVLTQEELVMALRGSYVLRVIYVEEPKTALPIRDQPGDQRYFEVGPGVDAMETADRLGRPVAILRMGSRVPTADAVDSRFVYHNPPLQVIEQPIVLPRGAGLEAPLDAPPQMGRPSLNFPRLR
ncbi:MAG: hypothetical protein WD872_04155 [Pirellulaceae bacterium]